MGWIFAATLRRASQAARSTGRGLPKRGAFEALYLSKSGRKSFGAPSLPKSTSRSAGPKVPRRADALLSRGHGFNLAEIGQSYPKARPSKSAHKKKYPAFIIANFIRRACPLTIRDIVDAKPWDLDQVSTPPIKLERRQTAKIKDHPREDTIEIAPVRRISLLFAQHGQQQFV